FHPNCLETIEEIDQENREYFMEAGGKAFHYIPALNADERHIEALLSLVENNLAGWPRPESDADVLQSRRQRAAAMGADA
ncbi:ferrochelatase, partial [Tamilnaduibacter salinus]|uniref:ferrochelatase n=1 Tax=Tamilnaduibacter salinus TaxID=1484056 RepID=UPI001B8017B6